jgi:hypothetical protein
MTCGSKLCPIPSPAKTTQIPPNPPCSGPYRPAESKQVQQKTTLYLDLDDNITAQVLPWSDLDLRPWSIIIPAFAPGSGQSKPADLQTTYALQNRHNL